MSSLLRTMMSRNTFTDPGKLYGLAQATAQNVRLSQSLAGVDTIVTMALALKNMNLSHLVFVQYPTGADPVNPNKVVPNTELADLVLRRIRADQPVALDRSALGLSTELAPTKGAATATKAATTAKAATTRTAPTPTATKSASAVIQGLRGQTAAQQTCSIAKS
jgi:hypothetical protein